MSEYGMMSVDDTSIDMTDEQQTAVEQVLNYDGRSLVLTGRAGAGKTTVIRRAIRTAPDKFSILAPTGRAAVNCGGSTVDSAFKFNRETWAVNDPRGQADMMESLPRRIIIDEASMIGTMMSHIIYAAARKFNKTIIMVGDWGQACPVKDTWPFDTDLFLESSVTNLQESHRQQGDFLGQLNLIRRGEVGSLAQFAYFKECIGEIDEKAICLYATNALANRRNQEKFEEHIERTGHEVFRLEPTITTNLAQYRDPEKTCELTKIYRGRISVGARVMITRNSRGLSYANGDTGYIMEMNKETKMIHICLDRTGDAVTMEATPVEIKDPLGAVVCTVRGYHFQLGYALTIHKAQGATIPRVNVSLSSIGKMPPAGRHGLAYVALSRCTSREGLVIDAWHPGCIYCDDEVVHML